MALPDHLVRFIDVNATGRVLLLCRSKGVWEQLRVDVYTRAVKQAMLTELQDPDTSVPVANACLTEQLTRLAEALDKPPPPRLPQVPTQEEEEPALETPPPRRRRLSRGQGDADQDSLSMERKLEHERKPLRKVLQEDCVRLGLLEVERAKRLSAQMAGKEPRQAEAEIVTELRNNLHEQIRKFMRKNKGGPWDSPKLQEDLRLDIVNTRSVASLVSLTRSLLRERKDWEEKYKKGRFSGLLGGKLKLTTGKS